MICLDQIIRWWTVLTCWNTSVMRYDLSYLGFKLQGRQCVSVTQYQVLTLGERQQHHTDMHLAAIFAMVGTESCFVLFCFVLFCFVDKICLMLTALSYWWLKHTLWLRGCLSKTIWVETRNHSNLADNILQLTTVDVCRSSKVRSLHFTRLYAWCWRVDDVCWHILQCSSVILVWCMSISLQTVDVSGVAQVQVVICFCRMCR